jgi:hypothetical protein
MPNFLFLLHQNTDRPKPSSPAEFGAIMKEYMAWTERLRAEGRHKGGEKLTEDPGKVLRPNGGRTVVTDGPYAESKEVVGGYYVVSAADYAEAVRVAEGSPHLKFGGRIEIRQIDQM